MQDSKIPCIHKVVYRKNTVFFSYLSGLNEIRQNGPMDPQLDTNGYKIYKFLFDVSIFVSMAEEKRKVNSWVPISLWEKVEKLGYDSPTRAVCDGLELLVNGHNVDKSGHNLDTNGYIPDTEIENLKLEINRLKTDLQRNTEHGENIQLQARIEDLKGHNETLQKELEKAAQEKEILQNLYNNYMLQMQTLINQKAIEAPGEKKPWWKFW